MANPNFLFAKVTGKLFSSLLLPTTFLRKHLRPTRIDLVRNTTLKSKLLCINFNFFINIQNLSFVQPLFEPREEEKKPCVGKNEKGERKEKGSNSCCSNGRKSIGQELKLIYSTRATSRFQKKYVGFFFPDTSSS